MLLEETFSSSLSGHTFFEKVSDICDTRTDDARMFCASCLLVVCLFVCLFSWRYNPFYCIFHSPVSGFSLLVVEVS
jgi:ABC-type multidrug transport system permease subunit